MQKKDSLEFECVTCQNPVRFSIFELDGLINCSKCSKKYAFEDEALKRQLQKFEALCQQLIDSEEILSNVAVGIDVGERQIKVPYRLLLTRLNSILELKMGDKVVSINFRVEPLRDHPSAIKDKKGS